MATAKQLLKEASNSNFHGFSTKAEAFLKVIAEDKVGHEEARLYSDFIQNCLHTLVTTLKRLQDAGHIEELLKTSIICGRAYRQLLPSLEKDNKHVVPSLLYHIVHSIQDSINTFANSVVTISELAYQMLDVLGFPESAQTIASAFHASLWNSSSKLLKQGSSQTLKHVLIFRKISLLFLCCAPLKNNRLVSMFQYTVTHYTQFNKDWIDKGTSEAFYSTFEAVVNNINKFKDKYDTAEERSACERLSVRIQAVLVEYLLKTSDYVKARQTIAHMSATCEKCSLYRSVVDCYSYAVTNLEALKRSQKPDLSSEKLKNTNCNLKQEILSGKKEELKLLFGALLHFIQSFSSKALDHLDRKLVQELTESSRILLTLCHSLQSECNKVLKKEADKKRLKELSDENVEYVTVCLQTYYRQLQFLHKILETNAAEDLCSDCVDLVEKFQQYLEDNISVLPKKSENTQRYNIGYISSIIGSACIQAGNYKMAASLYKASVSQLHRCQQPNLIRIFDKLIDCYVNLEKWQEATQTVYQALVTVDDGLKQVVVMWAKLKKEACSKEDIFQSMTLNAVVKSSSKEVNGVSSRQLLVAEYQVWEHYSRRQYHIEYHILRELLDVPQTPVQKAEVMVALAATICVTGYNPEDMSIGEMLNKAVILFDKNLAGWESSLAVACYTKYVLLHEEAVECMKNENGEIEYYGKGDMSQNFQFTLQEEQDNLPFLVRAIELWEKSLGSSEKASQRSSNAAKTIQDPSKTSEATKETLFGIQHHIDKLILCGTRLIAMKQPQLALRALQVAKDQLSNVKDLRRASDLSVQLSRALMLLGRYREAETVVDSKGDNKKQASPLNMSLLMSELCMLTGKRESGLEILQSVLDSEELIGKTQKVYLIQGTAKRLLSIALCLPGCDHMIQSANQYLLSIAFEAVQCHLTVINFLTKSKSLDQNADKWLILNEVLSSLLHLCRLYRFTGLPRDSLCYLNAGLKISQGQGLPRWSCEFLMEMLGVHSMEAEFEKALLTAESLNCILSTETQSTNSTQNQSRKGSKSENQSDKQSLVSSPKEIENFGFQESSVTPTMQMDSDTTEKTPERVYVKKELDSEKKKKMRKIKAPKCSCMVAKHDSCTDMVRHRLCMKAGIVLSDFLAQTDMRDISDKLLSEVQSKFEELTSIGSEGNNAGNKTSLVAEETSVVRNGHTSTSDPHILYLYLEACCIKAESYLHEKDFHQIHQIWKTFQDLEQSGSLRGVVHSNILLTRLALCDAAGYMLSLHGDKNETVTKLDQSEGGSRLNQSNISSKLDDTTQKLERLSLNPRRKVSFENETETLVVTETSVQKVKKKLARGAVDIQTPVKSAGVTVNTPKLQFSARNARNPLTTPSTNRMDVLEKLMSSDNEDDLIVFPDAKPVTPRVVPKSSKTSRVKAKCKTDTRNSVSKKPAFVIAEDPENDNQVACKLDFQLQTNEDVKNPVVKDHESKPRKQVKKEKRSLTSSANDTEAHDGEDVADKSSKVKSKTLKPAGRKSALALTKRVGRNDVKRSAEVYASPDLNIDSKTDKVLQEKEGNDKVVINDSGVKYESMNGYHDQFKGDVFDFEMEASPDINKATKTGKGRGKTKVSQKGKKTSGSTKASSKVENDDNEVGDKENKIASNCKRNTRRDQTKKKTDDTELVRRNSDISEELELSLEELSFDNDIDKDTYKPDECQGTSKLELLEPVITNDWLETSQFSKKTNDASSEPIEIMRGKTVTKSQTSKKSCRKGKKPADESVGDQAAEGNSSGEDGHNTSRSVEQMRSGRLTSMNDLADILDPVVQPSVSCVEMPLSGSRSPCGADIIPTLHSLYERLCQFPPNPQHSDVCHILALHYLYTDPRRAAFLLSDAMAVTFRHQVMLNGAMKARKEAKESKTAARKAPGTPNSIMFGRDDHRLTDMVNSIPEDWCVVQLSVVSVGLPWKQIILTRFTKDNDPVVLKLPGFSSPQGCHILKDFSLILERNAETAGITSSAEWWSARRKLDTDMENLVDRMEKHWLGCWRCALLPGEFSTKILDLACKDVSKVVQKDVKMGDIELLLLAGKVLTEKEIGQCVSDVVGPDVLSTHVDSIVSILKKYSSMATDKNDKQHTVLILDKTVQHLPWESMPILSDKSVSRMPCLSHLVMQLADHQTRKNSVFVKGVNPRNTFYILNPYSDLPRTEEFFKDWFESEKDWSGVIGCRPSSEQFIDALTNKDFFIYCGHGSGGRIFTSDEIEKLRARAVTMLMGCSSGRLLVKGQFEPSGMMISYFLAGCPSMVANLWDVTDKDIDKFTEEVIKGWMSSSNGTYLPKLVQKSRAVCKLKYLNGLAPVVYGLPVFINKGKK